MVDGVIDLHCHLLPELDDGSRDMGSSMKMIQLAYEDGIREIVFTPHLRRPWITYYSKEHLLRVYEETVAQATAFCPDMSFHLACEVYYDASILERYSDRLIPLGKDYCLVEFDPYTPYNTILRGLSQIRQMGLKPIIAHVERYDCLRFNVKRVEELVDMGYELQMNAETITRPGSWRSGRFIHTLLKRELISFVATDAHRPEDNPPGLGQAYKKVAKKYGLDYADQIFRLNACRILDRS